MRKAIVYGLVLTCCVMAMGCAVQQNIKNWTPKQKATFFRTMYNQEYDSYLAQAAHPVSKTRASVLEAKRDFLKQMNEACNIYEGIIDTGMIPSAELEQNLWRLLALIEGE